MNIDCNILYKLENLSKLQLNDANREITMKKIQGILDVLDRIDMNDIKDLEPLYHPLQIHQAMRADISNPEITRDYIQQQSPQTDSGLFLVPKVIE